MKTTVALIACLAGTVYAAAQQRDFDGKSLWRHVEVLAADDMEGRGIGAAGLERAQAYVVDQLKKAGLTPAGVNGFFQPVSIEQAEYSIALRRSCVTAASHHSRSAKTPPARHSSTTLRASKDRSCSLATASRCPKLAMTSSRGSISKARSPSPFPGHPPASIARSLRSTRRAGGIIFATQG